MNIHANSRLLALRTSLVMTVLIVALGTMFGPFASAAEIDPAVTSEAPNQSILDLLEQMIEADGGTGASVLPATSPTIFPAETPDSLGPGEDVRVRLGKYLITGQTRACATYDVRVKLTVTADGPDVFEFGFVYSAVYGDLGENPISTLVLGMPELDTPTELDQTVEEVSAEQLDDGLSLFYASPTVVSVDEGISMGYRWSLPDVTITENVSACDLDSDGVLDGEDDDNTDPCIPNSNSVPCKALTPSTTTTTTKPSTTTTTRPSTTTTTKPSTTTTTTTTAKPKSPAANPVAPRVSSSSPLAGGTFNISDTGYEPGTSVTVTLGGKVLGTAVAKEDGSYSIDVILPPDLSGSSRIETAGLGADGKPISRGIDVEVLGVTATAPSGLAATGSAIALPLTLFGLALAALGMLFVSRSRGPLFLE